MPDVYETFDIPGTDYRVITWQGVYIGYYNTRLREAIGK